MTIAFAQTAANASGVVLPSRVVPSVDVASVVALSPPVGSNPTRPQAANATRHAQRTDPA
jgi:hypothetical protein